MNKKGGWRFCTEPTKKQTAKAAKTSEKHHSDDISKYLNTDALRIDSSWLTFAQVAEEYSVSDESTQHSKIMMWQARLKDAGFYDGPIDGAVSDDLKDALKKEIKHLKNQIITLMFQNLKHKSVELAKKGVLHGNSIISKEDFGQMNAALCLCGKQLKAYERFKCKSVLNGLFKPSHYSIKELKSCYEHYRKLNQKDAACLCPVNPSIGPCGVPVHLDLYSGKKLNAIDIEIPKACQNLNVSTENVEIKGLKKFRQFEDYIRTTVKSHVRVADMTVAWEDKIPRALGKIARDNCEDLAWSVDIGHGALVINFKGLGMSVAGTCKSKEKKNRGRALLESSRRNRRLLQYAQVKGC